MRKGKGCKEKHPINADKEKETPSEKRSKDRKKARKIKKVERLKKLERSEKVLKMKVESYEYDIDPKLTDVKPILIVVSKSINHLPYCR